MTTFYFVPHLLEHILLVSGKRKGTPSTYQCKTMSTNELAPLKYGDEPETADFEADNHFGALLGTPEEYNIA